MNLPVPPAHLYKFRSLDSNAIDFTRRIITHDEIFFARPAQLNDPGELQLHISFDQSRNAASLMEVLKSNTSLPADLCQKLAECVQRSNGGIPSALWDDIISRQKQFFSECREQWGIFSMSLSPKVVPMWANYAANHTGICLEFKTDSAEWFEPWPCHYTTTCVSWNLVENPRDLIDRWLRTKHPDWAYEREWRNFCAPGVARFPTHLLTGVILGQRISDANRDAVKKWVSERSKPIPIHRIVLAGNILEVQ